MIIWGAIKDSLLYIKYMPKVMVKGKVKHFPYTKKGKLAAKKAKK
jgi:hypothetical protein